MEAAAKILNCRDIQVEASVLVQEAERAIAKANPPNPGGRGIPKKNCVIQDNAVGVSGGVVRQMRMAHEPIEDEEFEEVIEQAKEDQVPLTWKAWVDIAHKKRREKAREGSAARSRTIILSFQRTKLFPELRFAISDTPIVLSRILSSMR